MSTGLRNPALTTLWALAFFALVVVSRYLAITEPNALPVALISPSAGIGVVWVASAHSRRQAIIDSVVLVAAAGLGLWFGALVGATTQPPLAQYALLVVAPVQYVVAALLIRRWLPHLWGGGGRRAIRTLPELGLVLLAMTAAVLVYSVIRTMLGEIFIPKETLGLAVGRGTRSLSAMATLGVVLLLVGGWLAESRDEGRPLWNRPTPAESGILLAASIAAVAVLEFDFFLETQAPSTLLLMLVIALVAVRFGPLTTATFCLLSGTVVIALTIADLGTLSVVEDPVLRAALAQLLVVTLMVLGLVISVNRQQVLDTVEDLGRSERANARRAEELDLVMANLSDAVAIIEDGGRILHANAALRTAFGTQDSDDELDRVKPDDEIPDEERLIRGSDGKMLTDEISPLPVALAGQAVPAEEWRTQNPEGPIGWVTLSATPLPPDEGGLARAMIVLRDITATKAYQDQLETRAAELNLVIDKLNDGLAIIEEGGTFVQANDALGEIMNGERGSGAFKGEVDRDDAYHLYHPNGEIMADDDYPYMHALNGVVIDNEEFHLRRPDSPIRILSISAYPLRVELGAKRRAMVVVRDVTVERTYQDGLASFAGTVAHDLNNPLSVIDGWAEAIEEDLAESDDPIAGSAVEMVSHIRGGVEQMRGFIADLLAHAVARDQTLRCELVSLVNMTKHIASQRDRIALPGGGIVVGDLEDVWADKLLVRQVLDNLIGNATKYVAEDVVPEVHVSSARLRDGWVEVSVRDNGIGIPAAQRERVFDSFHRANKEAYAGTGLGLAICKRIVERHGGRIRIEDNPTGGSVFIFSLPVTADAFAAATSA